MITKKDLYEVIKDMPDDTLICLSPNEVEYYMVEKVECYEKQKIVILT